MAQDDNYGSGPWYNPENLNFKTENYSDENQNFSKNQQESRKSDDGGLVSELEDNALVFGAISMVLGIFSLLGEKLVFGILGLIFGKISNEKKRNTYARIGIICSIISLVIVGITLIVILTICVLYGTVAFEVFKDAVEISI